MNMCVFTLFTLIITVSAALACEYTIQDLNIKTCDNKPNGIELKNVDIKFTKDCNVQIFGCGKMKKAVKDISGDYIIKKNGMQVLKGAKKACKEKLFDKEIKCPLPENFEVCATNKWIYEFPKSALPMAVGNIQGSATIKTDVGNFCFSGTAKVKKN